MAKYEFQPAQALSTEWRKQLPMPVYDERPQFVDLYLKAWELAYAHIKDIKGMPQTPYMDEAFCDTQIWIWDTSFMSLFCKYARRVFPGVESLKNFYEVLYGNCSLPKVIPTEKEPEWTHRVVGEPYELKVHIADNPPLFAWGELENARMSGDVDYIKGLLKNQFLQKHYEWFEGAEETTKIRGVFCPTCLKAHPLGYKWEGGRSGMDNTPRGRLGEHALEQRPNNPQMLWLDALCQQAMAAKIIGELYEIAGDEKEAGLWNDRYLEKKALVNGYYWDEKDGFYYDIDCETQKFYKVKTIASYWAMTAGIASYEQAESLVKYLEDDQNFGGKVPFASLSRSDNDFCPKGGYWRGSVWLPTAYATLKGLGNYGFYKQAHTMSRTLLEHMLQTYDGFEPHTIWECYSPTEFMPAVREDNSNRLVRPDFCGWSALGPISIFIEYLLGFHTIDAFNNRVTWEKPQTDKKIGVNNLRFGEVITDICALGDRVWVTSNLAYTLVINGRDFEVAPGDNEFKL